jgi:hypothetical protein
MFRERRDVFSTLFAVASVERLTIVADGNASIVSAEYVSGDYFAGLGVRAAAGRAIAGEDDRRSAPPVAVISAALWKQRFGGEASVFGKAITLNGKPRTIVGVAPPDSSACSRATRPTSGFRSPPRAISTASRSRAAPRSAG